MRPGDVAVFVRHNTWQKCDRAHTRSRVIDVLIAVGVVFAWSIFVAPGHPKAYYQTAGIPIAQWSTRIAGTALIFGAAWLPAKRRPERNAYLFAVALVVGPPRLADGPPRSPRGGFRPDAGYSQ